MRYALSIPIYLVVVAVFMVWSGASGADEGAAPALMLVVLIGIHPVVGFVIGRAWALSLVHWDWRHRAEVA